MRGIMRDMRLRISTGRPANQPVNPAARQAKKTPNWVVASSLSSASQRLAATISQSCLSCQSCGTKETEKMGGLHRIQGLPDRVVTRDALHLEQRAGVVAAIGQRTGYFPEASDDF
jgi:hypothetical protein